MELVQDDLGRLATLCTDREQWLTERVLHYGRRTGYARYTSTLLEAWRLSIQGLSRALVATVLNDGMVVELAPDEDPTRSPGTRFGIEEARRHRERGVSLEMFLGLTKYYRESYRDLVREFAPPTRERAWLRFVDLFFDRFEIGFCSDWAGEYDAPVSIAVMQRATRHMTNEKNRYLTVFESLHEPAVILDDEAHVRAVNRAAAVLFCGRGVPGSTAYGEDVELPDLPWLGEIATTLRPGGEERATFETEVDTLKGPRCFRVRVQCLLDVSGKFAGSVAVLEDDTERQRLSREVRELRAELARLSGTALDEALSSRRP